MGCQAGDAGGAAASDEPPATVHDTFTIGTKGLATTIRDPKHPPTYGVPGVIDTGLEEIGDAGYVPYEYQDDNTWAGDAEDAHGGAAPRGKARVEPAYVLAAPPVASGSDHDDDDEPTRGFEEILDELAAEDEDEAIELPNASLAREAAAGPPVAPAAVVAFPSYLTFTEFRAIVGNFVDDAGPGALAELMLLQVVRRRNMSSAEADAHLKTITSPVFVSSAYGPAAHVSIRTSWRSVMTRARSLLRLLRSFIPTVAVRDCIVRSGPGPDALEHRGRVAHLDGNLIWAFMFLDIELYHPARLVRPVVSAGSSAWTTLHPSWCDNVGAGGAPHPSFAALTLAREATLRAANVEAAAGLRVVPMGLIAAIDGTSGGNIGRASLTPVYVRCSWLPHKRLHEGRGYHILALAQISKLAKSACENTAVAAVLRSALMQEILRACLCSEETLKPFKIVLPGEREAVLVVPYLGALCLDWGEVVVVCACGGSGKGCTKCLCPYERLGDPVLPGFCAGGGVFRNGLEAAEWALQRRTAGTTYAPVSAAEEARYRRRP